MNNELETSIYARLFPPKNRRGRDTKIKLVEATIEAISELGIENLTYDTVGKKLNTTPAQVKYHFMAKETLIERAIEYVLITYQETALKRLDKSASARDKILSLADGTFDVVIVLF